MLDHIGNQFPGASLWASPQAILNRSFGARSTILQITNHDYRLLITDYRLPAFPAVPAFQDLALYFVSALRHRSKPMEIDFQAIRTDELKSRIGELRRYL